MKVKPFKEEIIILALNFIQEELGQAQIASQLRDKYASQIPEWVVKHNLLLKKGLSKSIKSFIQMDKKIKKYYTQRKQDVEQDEQEQIEQSQQQPKPKKIRKKSAVSVQQEPTTQKPKKLTDDKLTTKNNREHHENTSKWVVSTFEAPKKLDQIDKQEHKDVVYHHENKKAMVAREQEQQLAESESEEPERKRKKSKSKKNKVKKTATIKLKQDSSEQSSEEEEKKPIRKPSKSKKEAKKQKQLVKKAQKVDEEQEEVQEEERPAQNNSINVSLHTRSHDKQYGKSFSRINPDEVGFIPENLRDNTFEAKFKYGKGGDEWGKFGYEKLKDTRGDSFKKTKGKLKNRAFQGANIDFNAVNSIAL